MSGIRWSEYFALTYLMGRFDLTGNAERLYKRRSKTFRIFWPNKRKRLGISKHWIARDLSGTWR